MAATQIDFTEDNQIMLNGEIIRPFEPDDRDIEAVVEIHNACWSDEPMTVEEWRHRFQSRDTRYFYDRWFYELNGQVVAVGALMQPSWEFTPGSYLVDIEVRPEFRGRGIGTQMWQHLAEIVTERKATRLVAYTREDQSGSLHMLNKLGFKQVLREPRSMLDVTAFDPTHYVDTMTRVEASGIELITLSEFMKRDPEWKQKLYEADTTIAMDIPMAQAYTPPPIEQYEKRHLAGPNFMPEAWMLALDEGEVVGISLLSKALARPEKLNTGLTGVRREYRRRGIATALKARAIAYAKSLGVKEIETGNEENNPMFQLNLALGYQPAPAWLHFAKSRAEEEQT
jgi:ribosomal protein S18 acetylase RimI-like enzyme